MYAACARAPSLSDFFAWFGGCKLFLFPLPSPSPESSLEIDERAPIWGNDLPCRRTVESWIVYHLIKTNLLMKIVLNGTQRLTFFGLK